MRGRRSTRPKYGSRKTLTADGKLADSSAEAAYYNRLLKTGKRFTYQQAFEILDAFKLDGKRYQHRTYRPDFCIYEGDRLVKVVDVKGGNATLTADASLRMTMFAHRYGIRVTLARYDYHTGLFQEEKF